jgi:hypothetical protein
VTVTPDSGNNNGTLNATADFNQDQDRSEMIVVAGGGLLKLLK